MASNQSRGCLATRLGLHIAIPAAIAGNARRTFSEHQQQVPVHKSHSRASSGRLVSVGSRARVICRLQASKVRYVRVQGNERRRMRSRSAATQCEGQRADRQTGIHRVHPAACVLYNAQPAWNLNRRRAPVSSRGDVDGFEQERVTALDDDRPFFLGPTRRHATVTATLDRLVPTDEHRPLLASNAGQRRRCVPHITTLWRHCHPYVCETNCHKKILSKHLTRFELKGK